MIKFIGILMLMVCGIDLLLAAIWIGLLIYQQIIDEFGDKIKKMREGKNGR